jgi:hypothetical protein
MTSKNFVVISNYGIESKTFTKCRENWAFYASHFPEIPFYVFREETTSQSPRIHFDGHDYLITLDPYRFPEESSSTYHLNSTWTSRQLKRIFERWTRQFEYVSRAHPDHFVVYTNITAFFCFHALNELVEYLPKANIYAGFPLFYRPESFFYHSGSGVIFSPDVIDRLIKRTNELSYDGQEAGDLVWGRLLLEIPRTILPFAQITPYTTPAGSFSEYLKYLQNFLDTGHFLFRFKNTELKSLREDIDPQLQLYAMFQSLRALSDRRDRRLVLIREEYEKILKGIGLTVIG